MYTCSDRDFVNFPKKRSYSENIKSYNNNPTRWITAPQNARRFENRNRGFQEWQAAVPKFSQIELKDENQLGSDPSHVDILVVVQLVVGLVVRIHITIHWNLERVRLG